MIKIILWKYTVNLIFEFELGKDINCKSFKVRKVRTLIDIELIIVLYEQAYEKDKDNAFCCIINFYAQIYSEEIGYAGIAKLLFSVYFLNRQT